MPLSGPLHRKLVIDTDLREEHWGTVGGRRLDLYQTHMLPKDKEKTTWLLRSVLVLALSYAEAWCS